MRGQTLTSPCRWDAHAFTQRRRFRWSGIANSASGTLDLTRSAISKNTATGVGGGIRLTGPTLNMDGSSIASQSSEC